MSNNDNQEKTQIVINMIKENISFQSISKIMGMSIESLQSIANTELDDHVSEKATWIEAEPSEHIKKSIGEVSDWDDDGGICG